MSTKTEHKKKTQNIAVFALKMKCLPSDSGVSAQMENVLAASPTRCLQNIVVNSYNLTFWWTNSGGFQPYQSRIEVAKVEVVFSSGSYFNSIRSFLISITVSTQFTDSSFLFNCFSSCFEMGLVESSSPGYNLQTPTGIFRFFEENGLNVSPQSNKLSAD